MEELWVYTTTDDDGHEGVAYVETAGGSKMVLVAETQRQAASLRPIATRMAKLTERAWVLRRFTAAGEPEPIGP